MKLSQEKLRQFVLTLILALGILGAIWHFIVQGLIAQREKNEQEKERLAAQIAERKKAYDTEIHNRDAAKVYQDFIAQWEKRLPRENVETWFVREISEVAVRHKLQVANTAMQPPREGSDAKFNNQPYRLVGFRFELDGEYNQIGRFLEDLENSLPLIEVDDLEFSAGTGVVRHIHKAALHLTMIAPR
ncbi:MAG: type 4a pilus biogenesis protein PilO [Verrucomicrobiae bacterium]|nr:type 4a pilus biogenesis protein PilO [Verrucomicrobiae bacterium]